MNTLLQIVPGFPQGIGGVNDYAITIARKFLEMFDCDTVFATPIKGFIVPPGVSNPSVCRFDVVALEHLLNEPELKFDRVLLHYVNYGFQKRGVPFRLLSTLRALHEQHRPTFVTIFHEFYASGPPWKSEFWLQPLQKDLAKSVAQLSDACIVTNDVSRQALRQLAPHAEIELHPVPSGLGEPTLSVEQIANRDPHRWVIFGGTDLAERSLRSFCQLRAHIPDSIGPRNLFVLGGAENAATRSMLGGLGIESIHRPGIAAAEASDILRTCSFAWFNYFHRPDVETSMILKSSAFASVCAHAVIPVLPHSGSAIAIDGDHLPGPFFVAFGRVGIPDASARGTTAAEVYKWYQRHVASEHSIQAIASALGLPG